VHPPVHSFFEYDPRFLSHVVRLCQSWIPFRLSCCVLFSACIEPTQRFPLCVLCGSRFPVFFAFFKSLAVFFANFLFHSRVYSLVHQSWSCSHLLFRIVFIKRFTSGFTVFFCQCVSLVFSVPPLVMFHCAPAPFLTFLNFFLLWLSELYPP